MLAGLAWLAGCRDPQIAEEHAIALAAGGREQDLEAGAWVCSQALLHRSGNTEEAWRLLDIREHELLGRLERRRVRYSDELDENGNKVPLRRHHPEHAKRVRPPRFLRARPIEPTEEPTVGPRPAG
jgi:hypothetical protein